MVAENKFGVSPPSDASLQIQTPNWNSVVGLAPRKPFYMEIWFLILIAASGSVLIILLIACLCIKSKAAKYRRKWNMEVSKTSSAIRLKEYKRPSTNDVSQGVGEGGGISWCSNIGGRGLKINVWDHFD